MLKPTVDHLPEFFKKYIAGIAYDDLIPALIQSGNETIDLFKTIPETSGDYRYAENKWSVKEVINHMMDAERVFSYRALTFSRGDRTELPGFDENAWTPAANAGSRHLYKLSAEYANLRASTVDLFGSLTETMLKMSGTASGVKLDVVTLGFLIVGHETHHRRILEERYFSK
ncbi:DinB family protein [Fulvivirga sp. M361]|uniref:DinB family protein n=1 Tax=Fulvivirga sp. M361 TaxID=2594266 RepID=UPI00117B12E9|nr:DinB family protein [Fulvivirga sp. M361]TRX58371.1 DinB family protein [Fulvivirga sp. M361]